MSNVKWRQQAESYLQQIIDLLRCCDGVDSIGQESYKSRFFAVFSDAFRSGFCYVGNRPDAKNERLVPCKAQRPLISGDAIWVFANNQGFVSVDMNGEEKRCRNLNTVRTWWNEWAYAWRHPVPRRKYVRRKPCAESDQQVAQECDY